MVTFGSKKRPLHSAQLILSLFLAGCASFGHTTVPQSRVLEPDRLNAGKAITSQAKQPVPWPSEEWWHMYGDPQLDRLVAAATSGNTTLRVAQARIAKVRALSGVARSALFPSLQGNAAFNRERFSENQFIPPPYAGNWSWNSQATVGLSYDLDLWGKQRNALAASLDYLQVATAEAQEVQLALQTAVVRSYLELSLQHSLLDIAQSTLKQREELLLIARKRLAAGLATELDVKMAETQLPPARAEVEKIGEAIELLHNQLSALTGKGPGDGEGIARPALTLSQPVGLPSALPADLLGRRPDVVAQRWRVEAAAKNIKVAKAAFFPNINLSAFAGWQSLGFSKFLSPTSLIEGFGPAVSLPIFEGGRLRSELDVSHADYDMAVESYNGTLVQALESVANEVVTLRSLQIQRAEARTSHDLAKRAYDIALQGFHAGITEYLNVLTAQNQTLAEAQKEALLEARFLDSFAILMQALGGGVQVTLPPEKPGSRP